MHAGIYAGDAGFPAYQTDPDVPSGYAGGELMYIYAYIYTYIYTYMCVDRYTYVTYLIIIIILCK
jgi:hypothetical protein